MGYAKAKNCDVLNSNIYSTGAYGGMACTTGIFGTVSGKTDIEDCDVYGTTITSTQGANASGLLGCSWSSEVTAKNSTVINSDITLMSLATDHGSNSDAAGLVSSATGSLNILGCKVEGCNINGKGTVTSGAVAYTGTLNISDTTVKNTNITDTGVNSGGTYSAYYRSTGGVCGYVGLLTANNITVDNVEINGAVMSTGGFAGSVSRIAKMTDCNVNKLTINNLQTIPANGINGSVAGLVADAFGIDTPIENCSVTNSTLTTNSDNIGGLIATINSKSTLLNCTVDNVQMENKNTLSVSVGNVAGLVSYAHDDIVLDKCNVKNSALKITGQTYPHHMAGLVAFTNDATITNSNVQTTTLINNTTGNTGGLVGMTNYHEANSLETVLNITNSNVQNCSNITGYGHTGGILGFGKLISTSGKVIQTTVNGNGLSFDNGGIIGNSLKTSNISNVQVEDSTIKSNNRVGGIAGFGISDITNCNIINTSISTTGSSADIAGIVGSACNTSSEITNCTVTNSNITGINGYTGGIAGFANNTITDSNVINTIIKATGETANGLGGIVGHGSNYLASKTYIENCEVNGCTLSGLDGVGGIAGAAVADIVNCRVIGIVSEEQPVLNTQSITTNNTTTNNTTTENTTIENTTTENTTTENTTTENTTTENTTTEDTTTENATTKNIANLQLKTVQPVSILTKTLSNVQKYSTTISGRNNVGGIIGDGGQLVGETVNKYVTLTNCLLKGTQITGETNVKDSIGRNSYYTLGETNIYDIIVEFITESLKIITNNDN